MTPAAAILETILYVDDLGRAEAFYRDVMGLTVFSRQEGRQVFFKLDRQMLLIFRPDATLVPPGADAKLPVPPHGATGPGHVCFAAEPAGIATWRAHLQDCGVGIEADFEWPQGGRSIYFRDPDGNSVEIAEARIWGFET